MSDDWPLCPKCDARRSTRCPICKTAGTDFEPVDMGFIWIPEGTPPDSSGACHCGPEGCTPGPSDDAGEDVAAGSLPAASSPASSPDEELAAPPLIMCHTCDEPFTPEYPRLCEWCGHEFPDGYDADPPTAPAEEIPMRVLIVVAALAALCLAGTIYFLGVLSPGG